MAQSGSGLMERVPITLGYYVNEDDDCRNPYAVTKFEGDRYLDVYLDENGQSGTDETRLASITGPEDGWYFMNWLLDYEPEEEDPTAMGVRPAGEGRIQLVLQDEWYLKFCPEEQIPAKFRR